MEEQRKVYKTVKKSFVTTNKSHLKIDRIPVKSFYIKIYLTQTFNALSKSNNSN